MKHKQTPIILIIHLYFQAISVCTIVLFVYKVILHSKSRILNNKYFFVIFKKNLQIFFYVLKI